MAVGQRRRRLALGRRRSDVAAAVRCRSRSSTTSSVDNRRPYWVYVSAQDYGTLVGPSQQPRRLGHHARRTGTGPAAARPGTSSPTAATPTSSTPASTWATSRATTTADPGAQRLRLSREPVRATASATAKYRFQWTAPILVSPHDSKTVYHAANVLFRTRDGGQTWSAISARPDARRQDRSSNGRAARSPATTPASSSTARSSRSPSRRSSRACCGRAATTAWCTSRATAGNAGTNVTGAIPGPPGVGDGPRPSRPRRTPAGTALLVVDAHRLDDLPSLPLEHRRLRPDLEEPDHRARPHDLPARRARGPGTHGSPLPRRRARRPGFLGRRLDLEALPSWACRRSRSTTWRSAERDLVIGTIGTLDLDPRRPDAAAAWTSGDRRERGAPLPGPLAAVRWRHGSTRVGRGRRRRTRRTALVLHYWLAKADLAESEELTLEIRDATGSAGATALERSSATWLPVGDPERSPWTEDPKGLPTDARAASRGLGPPREAAQLISRARIDWGDPSIGPLALPGCLHRAPFDRRGCSTGSGQRRASAGQHDLGPRTRSERERSHRCRPARAARPGDRDPQRDVASHRRRPAPALGTRSTARSFGAASQRDRARASTGHHFC